MPKEGVHGMFRDSFGWKGGAMQGSSMSSGGRGEMTWKARLRNLNMATGS